MKYLLLTFLLTFSPISLSNTTQQQCLSDLESLPGFLLTNDTGAPQHLAQYGQSHFDTAFLNAKKKIDRIESALECDTVIKSYLKAWRHSHLTIWPLHSESEKKSLQDVLKGDSLTPGFEKLSDETAYWSIPSFAYEQGKVLSKLLTQHTPSLVGVKNWIIDVRGNGGGSDDSYVPLLPFVLSGETAEVSVEFLSTHANILALEGACERFANNDPSCIAVVNPMIAKLRGVKSGEYAQMGESPFSYQSFDSMPENVPQKVAVLIDEDCASSCEQFLLQVRQSFKVKLVGRSSHGALDYSNLRPHTLPSGQRELFYATSRSLRLPHQPVDIAGISPDIYLPEPSDKEGWDSEISRVQRWLEDGSIKPEDKSAEQ
ncbi:Peptidase family S41 [Ferrimonas sediminum]|uniref:Peptidase family S41 n=1 Tax=Ferrimonas sediminum TaxID=718193 RepID=A0A1G8X4N9_9GAMM|nr:S41 family peptidase [Ferrimonas sediminum]SDJ85588.1 Peptidase family S41 [Ferrimonas sediminum]